MSDVRAVTQPAVRLFVAAEPREFAGMLKRCTHQRRENLPVHWAVSAVLAGKPLLAVANGAGARRAYAAVPPGPLEFICSVGFCGALDPSLAVAAIFAATHVNGEPVPQPRSRLPFTAGPMASVERVARTAAEKSELRAAGAAAVEMEAAGALTRARELAVPFFSIRAVTDLANETLHCDFQRALRDDGTISVARLAGEAVSRPFTCGVELLRLGRRSILASERLGEFLASCEF